ncbi:hypothetical protein ACU686_02035 [Yinghuangia aomiensis]
MQVQAKKIVGVLLTKLRHLYDHRHAGQGVGSHRAVVLGDLVVVQVGRQPDRQSDQLSRTVRPRAPETPLPIPPAALPAPPHAPPESPHR